MQPQTRELIDQEMARGRLRQKLSAAQARIAEGQALLSSGPADDSPAGQAARRWIDGMIRHWKQQAQQFEERLHELDQP
jgi:hypothetical protein